MNKLLYSAISLVLILLSSTTNARNVPPVVTIGGPYVANVGEIFALSTTVSDSDGDTLSFFWEILGDGDGCSIDDTSLLNPLFVCESDGEFFVSITVNDGTTISESSTALTVYPPGNTYGDVYYSGRTNIQNGVAEIVFEYADHFNTLKMSLGSCNSGIYDVEVSPPVSQTSLSGAGVWSFDTTAERCKIIIFQASIDELNNACGFNILTEEVLSTTMQGNVYFESTSNEINGRGEPYVRSESRGFTQNIILDNQVSTTNNVDSYGSVINTPKILENTYNPVTECVKVQFTTQIQYPYEVVTPTVSSPIGWSSPISQVDVGSGLSCNMLPGASSQLCEQTWKMDEACQTAKCADAIGLQLYLDASWSVEFDITCHSSFTGGCDVPAPSTSTVTFDTSSDNYCPMFLNTVSLTATLESYKDSARTIPTNEFVFGSKTYFRGSVLSDACITNAHADCVEIVSGGAVPNQKVYLDALNTDINTYFTTQIGTWSVEMSDPLVESVLVNQNTPVTDCHEMYIDFEWIWSDVNSNSVGDAPSPTVVKLCSRVRYEELDNNRRRLLQITNRETKPFVRGVNTFKNMKVTNPDNSGANSLQLDFYKSMCFAISLVIFAVFL
jgi:hypothetical protein